jgi:hypothetical protein
MHPINQPTLWPAPYIPSSLYVPSSPGTILSRKNSGSPLTVETSFRLLLAESPSMQAERAKWGAYACDNNSSTSNNLKRGSPSESSLLGNYNSLLGRSRSNSINKDERAQPPAVRRPSKPNLDVDVVASNSPTHV